MRRRITSFLLIFACVLALFWFLAGESLLAALQTGRAADRVQYALALDANGILYYVEDRDGQLHLVGMDDLGNLLVEKQAPVFPGVRLVAQSLFIASNRSVYLMAFGVDPSTEAVLRAVCIVFFEDSSTPCLALDRPLVGTYLQGENAARFASASQQDASVHLALYSQGKIDQYSHALHSTAQAQPEGQLLWEGPAPLGLHALPDGRVAASCADGRLALSKGQSFAFLPLERQLTAHTLYFADQNSFYLVDGLSRDVVRLNVDSGAMQLICEGSAPVADGLLFSGLEQLAVGARGKLAGAVGQGDAFTVYTGSQSRMARAGAASAAAGFSLRGFYLGAAALGVVLLSLLIWDAYVYLLKMRLSLLIRQAALSSVLVLVMVQVLSVLVSQSLFAALEGRYVSQIAAACRVMAASVAASSETDGQRLVSRAHCALDGGGAGQVPVQFRLLERGDTPRLLASNLGLAQGTLLEAAPYAVGQKSVLAALGEAEEAVVQSVEPLGKRLNALRDLGNGRALLASVGLADLEMQAKQDIRWIRGWLLGVGALLVLGLMLVESATVRSIRRLKRGVDAVSAGDYTVTLTAQSGDEVENLTHAFNAMTQFLRESTLRLERVSSSYYRFVPEKLVNLLGEDSIGQVDKRSHMRRRMAVLLLVFRFSGPGAPRQTQELFTQINGVLESLSPLVSQNGGTVLEFANDGFVAVFSQSAQAVKAALRIREQSLVLQEKRDKEGLGPVDARLALGAGEVMLGIVGDEQRMAPAAISEVIQRLRRLCRLLWPSDLYILAEKEAVEEQAGYRLRPLGVYEDESGPVQLIDLYDGDPYALCKGKQSQQARFAQALAFYYARDFVRARELLMGVVKACPQDGVARNYLYRADRRDAQDLARPSYRLED